MNEKYSTITFCRTDYKEYGEVNEEKMWNDIRDFMRIAIFNGYQMRVLFDGLTVIIQYNLQDAGLSGVDLAWLGEDEYVAKEGEEHYDCKVCSIDVDELQ